MDPVTAARPGEYADAKNRGDPRKDFRENREDLEALF